LFNRDYSRIALEKILKLRAGGENPFHKKLIPIDKKNNHL
jgi:hypothetical protein